MVLRGDVAQHLPTHGIDLAIAPEKAHRSLFLLKGLDRGVQQDAIEATIGETQSIFSLAARRQRMCTRRERTRSRAGELRMGWTKPLLGV